LVSGAKFGRARGKCTTSSLLPLSRHPNPQTCTSNRVTPLRINMAQGESINEEGPLVKRRKVRKGTQSCWECKRRKVRCTYAVAGNTTCDNCLRRRTKCTSQDYFDDQDSPTNSNEASVEARLRRVEDVLQQLVENTGALQQNRPELSGKSINSFSRERTGASPESEGLAALEHQLQTENIEVRDSWLFRTLPGLD
jgi:hypothetical protein